MMYINVPLLLCTLAALPISQSFAPCTTPRSTIAVSPLFGFAERKRIAGRGSGRGGGRGGGGGGRSGSGSGSGSGRGGRSSDKPRQYDRSTSDNSNSASTSRQQETKSSYNNNNNNNYDDDDDDDDPFGDYDDGYVSQSKTSFNDYDNHNDYDNDFDNDNDFEPQRQEKTQQQISEASHFFSKKPLSDPKFSIESQTFKELCRGAGIVQPSRIQALAWPKLVAGDSVIVADQTGSGKTLSYLIPLLQRMMNFKETADKKTKEYGAPKVLILAPTAELADQIKAVCDKTTADLSSPVSTRVITATGAHSTNIRDQIRMLGQTPIDILISTPGRIATILRTKSSTLNLSNLQAIVLDEVDVLLIDETFGPQLRTIGAAAPVAQVQFVFVTATLPNEIIEAVKREFKDVDVIQGPGLHRVAPNLKEHLVDVSVPATDNKNLDLCFEYKANELMKALRSTRCKRTLVFCNTVEACRQVENLLKRSDRRGRLFNVSAYHNAMTPDARRRNLSIFAKGLDREVKGGRVEVVDHVLVCTDRAARGVDFDSAPVEHVVIFDFPKDPAEYVRRVGRTARAGRTGTSTVFAFSWQLPIARKIMGSKLESYSVASEAKDVDDDEYSQQQRQMKRSKNEKDQMLRGNIETGKQWKQ